MGSVGIHPRGEITLEKVVHEVRKHPDSKRAGALVTFVGIVREDPVGTSQSKVQHLEYEAFQEVAVQKLNELRNDLVTREGIVDISIHHIVGRVGVGQDSLIVVVLGTRRKHVFPVLEEAVERVKRDIPIWKKEYTSDNAYWVSNKPSHGISEERS